MDEKRSTTICTHEISVLVMDEPDLDDYGPRKTIGFNCFRYFKILSDRSKFVSFFFLTFLFLNIFSRFQKIHRELANTVQNRLELVKIFLNKKVRGVNVIFKTS